LAEQRLMRYLDRRPPRVGIPVERQQAMTPERIDDALHRATVDLQRRQLGSWHEASRVIRPLPDRHEPEDKLPGRLPADGVTARVQKLGPSPERSRDPAGVAIRLERQDPSATSIEGFGE